MLGSWAPGHIPSSKNDYHVLPIAEGISPCDSHLTGKFLSVLLLLFFLKAVLPLQENFSNLGSSPDHVPAQLGVTFKPCLSLQHFPPSTLPTLIAVFFTQENRKSPRRASTFSSTQCAAESAEIPTREQHFSCRLWSGRKTLQSVKSREETGSKGGLAMWGLRSHDPFRG